MIAWLIDTLLYSGLLIGLVLVLRRPVGRFFGPQLAYGLWALPFLRLLLPPIVLPASFAPEPTAEIVPAAAPAATKVVLTIVEVPADIPAFDTMPAAAPAPLPPAWEWSDLLAPALSVWAGVALAFLAWRVVTYHQMRRELLAGARPVGEIGKVRLVETPALAAPVAFGVFDKVIGLPPLFMAQHDTVARDLAIEHELAHHRGGDLLANFAAQALLALHWFNPLAWYGWRAMRRDQEAACDARVLAGRGREDRIRYAKLIAGVATGPRLALAAPMACPVLGERSIVHRLRSLSMSETSRRRRWFGRTLVGASALALPLTASISYAASAAQEPAPPAPLAAVDPDAPEAAEAPEAPDASRDRRFGTIIMRRGPNGEPVVERFGVAPHPMPRAVPMPAMPQFHFEGNWDSPEFRQRMEEFQRQMQAWGDEHGQEWAQWAEQQGQHWQQWTEQHREQLEAQAERQRELAERLAERQREKGEQRAARAAERAGRAAEQRGTWAMAWNGPHPATAAIVDCDDDDGPNVVTSEDGNNRIVICNRMVQRNVFNSLRSAREQIASNRQISAEVRNEILEHLDEEIERIEREDD
jgi:beta-lactamase regulating signal transducer with metallopeptidase domain